MLEKDHETSKERRCGEVVVTGQPGVDCFRVANCLAHSNHLFNIDEQSIQRQQSSPTLLQKWDPSTRTCLRLLQGGEEEHGYMVTNAAHSFVENPRAIANFEESKVSRLLFPVQPKGQDRTGRNIQVAEMATDYIKEIISYVAADASAQDHINFFQKISTQPSLRVPASRMFKGFVLSWLYARPNVEPLRCFTTGQEVLEILACGTKQTAFFRQQEQFEDREWGSTPILFVA
ncbi:hypothetical protein H4582DRAFT_2065041 [Lactarius indigo]|nr:hypothetical protein H4582DRAFT_2065041 [Lactarius indigo]